MTRSCSSRWVVSVPTRVADSGPGFDALVFIGRFQPVHAGHLHVIGHALASARHLVILLGSARQPRGTRNPWTVSERVAMLQDALPEAERTRVQYQPVEDVLYDDDSWIRQVREAARAGLSAAGVTGRVGLIGHEKDDTSYYLRLFPDWEFVPVDNHRGISATPIRERLLRAGTADFTLPAGDDGAQQLAEVLPPAVQARLAAFLETDAAAALREEQRLIDRWRADWSVAPYPPVFVTVDALVTCAGRVLLVERGGFPGRGLLALPGGFLDPGERLTEACLRELAEETGIDATVPAAVLESSYTGRCVFDEPGRSVRGRTLTHVHRFELPGAECPVVRAADDARDACWVPLAEVDPERMFEDHYFILRAMLGADALRAD